MKTLIKAPRQTRNGSRPPGPRSARKPKTSLPAAPEGALDLKSLLVPTDFSEASVKALDYSISLARQFGSTINLVHVIESPKALVKAKSSFASREDQLTRDAKTQLDNLAQAKIDELIPAYPRVLSGRPYQEICKAAQNFDTDLIVISTHGYTGLKHLLLGSTAERVVRHAPCSVLVVRGREKNDTEPKRRLQRILVPTDFSERAQQALAHAIRLAQQYHAEIQLLYVVPAYYTTADEMMQDMCILEAELKESGEKQLARMLKSISGKAVSVRAVIRKGRAATEITEAIKDLKADLVVIATHGLTGWDRAFLGSTTEEVVRHASCPVLVVREKQPVS